jgi:AcrR family transcriptional regulator
MTFEELTIKKKIIKATFEMLVSENIDNITVRNIAKAADVAVSAINYHFQTKENLIETAIKDSVGDIVGSVKQHYIETEGEPADKLRIALKETCKYMTSMPNITKISILSDYNAGYSDDNIKQSSDVLELILGEIFDGKNYPAKTYKELKIIAYMIVGGIEFGFFRAKQMQHETGMDFFKDEDRNKYLDSIVDNIIFNSGG